ncbi:MAG TPA: NAD(P)-binding protein [Roseiflexaceae bacterium]|nr:NAD(P)-binding protein [Roseiflexaceae bacterium]
MSDEPIRIAGAGLAGLSAAIGLAGRGHRVDVFEKNADSGAARHSDWDAIENWTTETDMLALLRGWGIAPSFEHRSKLDFEVYDKDGVCYPVTTPRPFFYLLKRGPERGSVEQELKRQALDHGVRIHYGRPRQRADVDIWAAGSQHGGFFLGAGMTFRTSHPDLVLGLVSSHAAPKAYAYLVIVDGEGTLSVVLTRDFKRARAYLNHCIAIFRKVKQFDMDDVKMTSGFGGLASAFFQPASHPIVVGEAAGFQDFLWGFGIRYALFSGHLAARAIDEGRDYEALVAREIRPLVRSSMVNRALYDWAGDRTYRALIRRFSASPDLPELTRRWYRGMAFRHLIWPLAKRRYSTLTQRPDRDSTSYLRGPSA